MNKKLKVVVYCRAANESQFAIDNQRKILELYCKMKRYKLITVVVLMVLDQPIKRFEARKIQSNSTCNMDRLNRSFDKMIDFMELLNNSNCRLETLDYSNEIISKILENIRFIQRVGMYLRFSTEEKAKVFFGFESRGVR